MTTKKERYIATRADLTEALRLLRNLALTEEIKKKVRISDGKLTDLRSMCRLISTEDWDAVSEYAAQGRREDRRMVVEVVAEEFGVAIPEYVFKPERIVKELKLGGHFITEFLRCPQCGSLYVLKENGHGGKFYCCPNGMGHETRPALLSVEQVVLANNALQEAFEFERERLNKALRGDEEPEEADGHTA